MITYTYDPGRRNEPCGNEHINETYVTTDTWPIMNDYERKLLLPYKQSLGINMATNCYHDNY